MTSLRSLYEHRTQAQPVPVTALQPLTPQWRRTTITILDTENTSIPLPGYIRGGLGVHRIWTMDKCLGQSWTITHLDSGLRFGPLFRTKRAAQAAAEQLLCIEGLWNQPLEALAQGLSATDATRCNAILGTAYQPGQINNDIRRALAHRAALRKGAHNVR
jgi:hypothetical protein